MVLATRLTARLGIAEPVILAPMGNWSDASLCAAVSNAGGLGTFGAAGRYLGLREERVRQSIASVRDATDKPFGAGFITPLIAENPANLDLVLEAGVPVVLFSFGDPTPYVALAHQGNATVICQVQSFAGAQLAVDAGADIVCVQGHEAGGHTGTANLLPLLTQVLDAFPEVGVVASGGVSNGRALAAVLAAGADGAWVGTAFLAASEAAAVPAGQQDALVASDGSDTLYSPVYDILLEAGFRGPTWPDGVAFRMRRMAIVERWHGREDELIANLEAELPGFRMALRAGEADVTPIIYGEGARSVRAVRPAADILHELVADAADYLRRAVGFVVP